MTIEPSMSACSQSRATAPFVKPSAVMSRVSSQINAVSTMIEKLTKILNMDKERLVCWDLDHVGGHRSVNRLSVEVKSHPDETPMLAHLTCFGCRKGAELTLTKHL